MRIDFLGLEAFVCIAERSSFHRAAAHLNVSQTALSHRMRKLEDELGFKLLARTTRRIELTKAGLELLPRAQRTLEDLAASIADVRRYAHGQPEQIAIGCLPTLAVHYLPRILSQFTQRYPDIAIRVYDNSASEIAELIESNTIELGLTIAAANRHDLDIRPLLKEAFVLVCRPGHELAAHPFTTWSALTAERLIRISPQAGNRALIDDALGARSKKLNWCYEVQHLATAVRLVKEGLGCTIVPHLAVASERRQDLSVVALRAPKIARTLAVISKVGRPVAPETAFMIQLIRDNIRPIGR